MIYALIIISVLIIVFGLISTSDNIFSPSVITAAVWLLCLVLYLFLPHGLPPLTNKVFTALLLWIVLLSLSSLFIQPIAIKRQTSVIQASKLIRDIYLVISIIALIFLIFWVKNTLKNGFVGNWAGNLRMAALGGTEEQKEIYGGIQVMIWQITLILELIYFDKKRWYRFFIPLICCLSFGFFTMTKGIFLSTFILCVSVLFFKKKIKILHVTVGLLILFTFFVFFQTLRQNRQTNKESFAVLYVVSSMYGFESVKPASSEVFGENTCRIFYAASNKLGFSDRKPIDPILKFVEKPIVTNIYTGIYPYYKDFGLYGIIIFSILLGLLYGYLFAKAKAGSAFFIALYAFFAYAILMQYAADLVITNIAAYLKFTLLLAIPFIAEKYRFFYFKNKIADEN